jgi:hypothetical protein
MLVPPFDPVDPFAVFKPLLPQPTSASQLVSTRHPGVALCHKRGGRSLSQADAGALKEKVFLSHVSSTALTAMAAWPRQNRADEEKAGTKTPYRVQQSR